MRVPKKRTGRSCVYLALGYKRTGLYGTQAKLLCSWVNLIDIFHEAR